MVAPALLTSGCAYFKLLHSSFSVCALSIMRMEVKCVPGWAGHGHHLPRITHRVQTNKWPITGSRMGCHPINLSGFIATNKIISEKPGPQTHERNHSKSRVHLSHLHPWRGGHRVIWWLMTVPLTTWRQRIPDCAKRLPLTSTDRAFLPCCLSITLLFANLDLFAGDLMPVHPAPSWTVTESLIQNPHPWRAVKRPSTSPKSSS